MVLSDNSLISLLFSLVKEYLFRMNLEILILHFENKICFDVSLKQFALEFLQLLVFVFCFLFFFLEKKLFAFMFGDIVFGESMSWGDYLFLMGFQIEGLEKKLEVLFEKNLSLFEHLFYQHE